jgi:hypothetical protein
LVNRINIPERALKMKAKKRKSLANRIIKGLTELAETLERGEALEKRFTVHTVQLPPKPAGYKSSKAGAGGRRGQAKG